MVEYIYIIYIYIYYIYIYIYICVLYRVYNTIPYDLDAAGVSLAHEVADESPGHRLWSIDVM